MAEGPIILLNGAAGRTFIETGLVVIRDTRDRLFSKRSNWADRDLLNNIAIHHEWVHYMQSITCASVNYAAQKMLSLSADAVKSAAQGNVPDEIHQQIRGLTEHLYGRRSEDSIQIMDQPGSTFIIPIPDSHQLGMLDLIEGVAVLESFKLCTSNAGIGDFLNFRDRYLPGSEKSVYRWSFNWLASKIGPEAAYELLAPVSYLALQVKDPAAEFVRIIDIISKEEKIDFHELSNVAVLAVFIYGEKWESWLHAFEHGEPENGHVTLDRCATFAVGQLGVGTVNQLGATPSRVTAETYQALRPPVTAYSHTDSVTFALPAYSTGGLAELVIDWTSVVGAAERLTILAETDVYQFCPHRSECSHFESALCHRNYAPPAVNRNYDQCRFPKVLSQMVGFEPRDLWALAGYGRKSVHELIEAFKTTAGGNLWSFFIKQRGSIIALLGIDVYNDLKWKCEVVANKTLRALQTQAQKDIIESIMFRDAVVQEILKKLASSQQYTDEFKGA